MKRAILAGMCGVLIAITMWTAAWSLGTLYPHHAHHTHHAACPDLALCIEAQRAHAIEAIGGQY